MVRYAWLVVIGCIAPVSAAEPTFREFRSEAGRFVVAMPGTPTTEVEKITPELNRTIFTVGPTVNTLYHLSYCDLGADRLTGKDPKQFLKIFQAGYREGMTLKNERELAWGPGVVAREYTLSTKERICVRERLILAGTVLYVQYVAALESDSYLTGPSATKFFDSLVVGGVKAPQPITARTPWLGEWTLVRREFEGQAVPSDEIFTMRVLDDAVYFLARPKNERTAPDGVAVLSGGAVAPPYALTVGSGRDAGRFEMNGDYPVEGIYKIEGDTLTICWVPPGATVPKGFATAAGSTARVDIYKRNR